MIRPLLQEIYKDPWQMLVCCILLNLTHRRQVDKVREELFTKWPTPEKMMHAKEKDLSKLLQPLGFYNKRAKTLIKMSKQWVTNDPTWIHVGDLPGIGEYAIDSWEKYHDYLSSPESRLIKRPSESIFKVQFYNKIQELGE